jgi:hypothetical protein
MSHKLTIRPYKGKTYEWLFFHDPKFVTWVIEKDIPSQRHNFSEEQEEYFRELYRRASHLTGLVCPYCKKRPITRMCLLYNPHWQGLNNVKFDCDECGYPGGAPDGYVRPSFFPPGEDLSKSEHKIIVSAIRHQFIDEGRLTQKAMEQFFRTDAFFPNATPGFFANVQGERKADEVEEEQPEEDIWVDPEDDPSKMTGLDLEL